MTTHDYIVKPVYKALQVLRCLGEERRALTLTEICHQVRLPKTTVFRYLCTLRACGFVTHDAQTDLYRLGPTVFELGRAAGEQLRIRDIALPLMQELRDRFNETVNLGILDGQDVIYLEMVESRHSLRMQARIGSRDPVYSTALGKAILAFLRDDEWPRHLPSQLMPRTPNTITSAAALEQELAKTRARGFAVDHEENEDGARCVGAPIFDHLGQVTAAISVSAPASRINDILESEITQAIVKTAGAISEELGYQKSSNGRS